MNVKIGDYVMLKYPDGRNRGIGRVTRILSTFNIAEIEYEGKLLLKAPHNFTLMTMEDVVAFILEN